MSYGKENRSWGSDGMRSSRKNLDCSKGLSLCPLILSKHHCFLFHWYNHVQHYMALSFPPPPLLPHQTHLKKKKKKLISSKLHHVSLLFFSGRVWMWTCVLSHDCSIFVNINPSDGNVTIGHSLTIRRFVSGWMLKCLKEPLQQISIAHSKSSETCERERF